MRERREREMCVLFEFRQFLTPRTRLRISKFHVYLSSKNLIDESFMYILAQKTLSTRCPFFCDCITL